MSSPRVIDVLLHRYEVSAADVFLRIPIITDSSKPPIYDPVTIEEFTHRCYGCANALKLHSSFKCGDIVIILYENSETYLEIMFGLWFLGCIPLLASTRLDRNTLCFLAKDSEAVGIISSPSLSQSACNIQSDVQQIRWAGVVTRDNNYSICPISVVHFEQSSSLASEIEKTIDTSDISLVLHTTGTTSQPKLVGLSHSNILFNREAVYGVWQSLLSPGVDSTLSWLPFFHVMGGVFEILGNLYNRTITTLSYFDGIPTPCGLLNNLKWSQATIFYTVPIMLEKFCLMISEEINSSESGSDDSSSTLATLKDLHYIMSGGAPLPDWVGEFLTHKNVPVIQGEGMTEVGGALFLGDPRVRTSDGYVNWKAMQCLSHIVPFALFENRDGLQYGVLELVLVKCPTTMIHGYLHNVKANTEYFIGPDRFSTRDLFSVVDNLVEENGDRPRGIWYSHMGRLDDVVLHTNGEKSNPIAIEQGVLRNEFVSHCVAVGHQRPYLLLLIDLKPNCANDIASTLESVWNSVRQVNQQQPRYSCIHKSNIIILPSNRPLPLSPKGEVIRKLIMTQFADLINPHYDMITPSTSSSTPSVDNTNNTSTSNSNLMVVDCNKRLNLTITKPVNEQPTLSTFAKIFMASLFSPKAVEESSETWTGKQLQSSQIGSLSALSFSSVARRAPGNGEIEVRIFAAGVNFRDLLIFMGMLDRDPTDTGSEFCGQVTRVGTHVDFYVGQVVVGFTIRGSFKEYLTTTANLVVVVPACNYLRYTQLAACPVAMMTAILCLSMGAPHLKKGSTVLVHQATGGVGLTILQLCKNNGYICYATTDTEEKHKLLRDRGAKATYSSRSLDFMKLILIECPSGVDLVVNSLPGGMVRGSLDVVHQGGSFVELGKPERGCWDEKQVKEYRPDIHFTLYNLEDLLRCQPDMVRENLVKIMENIRSGALLPPFPLNLFYATEGSHALVRGLRMMQQSLHTGKCVFCFHKDADASIDDQTSPRRQQQSVALTPVRHPHETPTCTEPHDDIVSLAVLLLQYIVKETTEILECMPGFNCTNLNADTNLFELGVDSLGAVEMARSISFKLEELGYGKSTVTPPMLFANPSPALLTLTLLRSLIGVPANKARNLVVAAIASIENACDNSLSWSSTATTTAASLSTSINRSHTTASTSTSTPKMSTKSPFIGSPTAPPLHPSMNNAALPDSFYSTLRQMKTIQPNLECVEMADLLQSRDAEITRLGIKDRSFDLRPVMQESDHLHYMFEQLGRFRTFQSIKLTGTSLQLGEIVAMAKRGIRLDLDQDCYSAVCASVAFLAQKISKGEVVYGVNSGFGGSSSLRTHDVLQLQKTLISFLCAGVSSAGTLDSAIVRSAMMIRANCLLNGASGIRWEIIERLITLCNRGITPCVPLRGSISASGDLVPFAHIVACLIGRDEASAFWNGREISAKQVMDVAGCSPIDLHPKEALALCNGTPVSTAAAALGLYDANILAVMAQVATALCAEAMLASNQSFVSFTHILRPHTSQQEVAGNILYLLQGSRLIRDESRGDEHPPPDGDRQDRYALRCSPQWLGPQLDVLRLANREITIECNSVTDNPLIDVEHQRVLHGGNFQGSVIGVWMDNVRLSLALIGKIIFSQFSELTNVWMNRGLPRNLAASDPSQNYSFKGVDITMASYMSELSFLASPVSTHMVAAEECNQDVNSLALVSARYTIQAVDILSLMFAAHILACLQAMDLRALEIQYRHLIEKAVDGALASVCLSMVNHSCESIKSGTAFLGLRQHPTARDMYETLKPMLTAAVDHQSPLRLIHDVDSNFEALLQPLREAFVLGLLEYYPSMHILKVEDFTSCIVTELKQTIASLFLVTDAVNQAHGLSQVSHAGHGVSRDPLVAPRLRPIYEFVRNDLGVKMISSGLEMPGPRIEKIYNSIKDGRINAILMQCFL